MLRSRTGTGSQVLAPGQTTPSLRVVSLAGQSGFARTANVYGFNSSSTPAQTQTQTQTQTRTITAPTQTKTNNQAQTKTRMKGQTAAGAPAPGDPGGSRTMTVFADDEKKRRKREKKEEVKARKARERVEGRERKVRERREEKERKEREKRERAAMNGESGCFGWRRNGNARESGVGGAGVGMGGSGGVMEEKGNGGGDAGLMARRVAGGAPGPEDPGGSAMGIADGNEKPRRGIMPGGVVEEKERGCFGCRWF